MTTETNNQLIMVWDEISNEESQVVVDIAGVDLKDLPRYIISTTLAKLDGDPEDETMLDKVCAIYNGVLVVYIVTRGPRGHITTYRLVY